MKATTALIVAILSCGVTAAALAEPPEGRGWKKHKRYAAKEEFWDGNCKVKRKWKRDGSYKEERECRPVRHRAAVAVALPPWFDGRAPEPEYHPEWRPETTRTVSRCNSQQVGNVLGGLIGGVIGHQIGDGRGNTAATIGGSIAGVLIGGEIGRRIDSRNQACMAQVLEFAPEGQRVSWEGVQDGRQYAVTPGSVRRQGDQYCRSYTAEVLGEGQSQAIPGVACRNQDGSWVQSF